MFLIIILCLLVLNWFLLICFAVIMVFVFSNLDMVGDYFGEHSWIFNFVNAERFITFY